MGRKSARANRLWVGAEFARERQAIAWSLGIVLMSFALLALIALVSP